MTDYFDPIRGWVINDKEFYYTIEGEKLALKYLRECGYDNQEAEAYLHNLKLDYVRTHVFHNAKLISINFIH